MNLSRHNISQPGLLAVLLCMAAAGALAQQDEELPAQYTQQNVEPTFTFGGSLYVEGRYVHNATRVTDQNDQVEEFQSQYGAELSAALDRETIALSADYHFYQADYAKESQEDRFIRTGQSSLVFGTDQTFYQVEATHSTQRFLRDPGGPAILQNTDQRDIASVSPLLRLRPGRSNSIALMGHYANVTYKATDLNDSERAGVGLSLLRRVSPLYTAGVRGLQNEVDYDLGNNNDYTYRRAAFVFLAELRRLEYEIELGLNEADPQFGAPQDELYYNLSVMHGRHRNNWTLTAHRAITDTSLGNANDPFFSEGITTDVSNLVQDQVERRSYGVGWQSDFICGLCDFGVRAGYEDERFFTVVSENREETFMAASLDYRLQPEMDLQFVLEHRLREFTTGADNGDYGQTSFLTALEVSPVFRVFETRVWAQYELRSPEQGQNYSANTVGVTLAYIF